MKTFLKVIGLLLVVQLFAGCAANQEDLKRQSFMTVRADASNEVTQTSSWKPGMITAGSALKYYGWGPNAEQYRYVFTLAILSKADLTVSGLALVPDQIPELHKQDIIDVWFPNRTDLSFNKNWNVPVVIGIVCKTNDRACKQEHRKQTGFWVYGVENRKKPDLSKFTFSKYYDKQGHLLPHPIDPMPGTELRASPVPVNLPVLPGQLEK